MALPETNLTDEFRQAGGISLIDKAGWDAALRTGKSRPETSDDPLAMGTIKLAYAWAKIMEPQLREGRKMDDIAWTSFLAADDLIGGATGAMAKSATAHLGRTWTFGQELVDWHNRQADRHGTAPSMVGKISL